MNVSNTSRCIRECPSGVWPEGRLFQQLNQRLTHISGKSQIIILILQRHKWNSSVSVTQETGLHPPGLSVQQQSRYYCQFLLWYFNLLWCFFNVFSVCEVFFFQSSSCVNNSERGERQMLIKSVGLWGMEGNEMKRRDEICQTANYHQK